MTPHDRKIMKQYKGSHKDDSLHGWYYGSIFWAIRYCYECWSTLKYYDETIEEAWKWRKRWERLSEKRDILFDELDEHDRCINSRLYKWEKDCRLAAELAAADYCKAKLKALRIW